MKDYKYYTPVEIANILVDLLPRRNYKKVIDICCGSWSLLRAAKNRFPYSNFTGVDVDNNARNNRIEKAYFYNLDGREFAIKEKNEGNTYDLILSNPPYGNLDEKNRKFNGATFNGVLSNLNIKRYENEMMQANFLLAHKNSVLVFILPSTFVEGTSFCKIRKGITKEYKILTIVKLPDNTFRNKKISTYAIIVMKNNNEIGTTNLYKVINKDGSWGKELIDVISFENINMGTWIYHNQEINRSIDIKRGNISSGFFKLSGDPVLHCSSKIEQGKWLPSVRYYCINDFQTCSYSEYGDILVNRIGRYAGHWCINKFGKIPISDCLIKIPTNNQNVLDIIIKNTINGRLDIPIRGLTASYITAQDITRLFC